MRAGRFYNAYFLLERVEVVERDEPSLRFQCLSDIRNRAGKFIFREEHQGCIGHYEIELRLALQVQHVHFFELNSQERGVLTAFGDDAAYDVTTNKLQMR